MSVLPAYQSRLCIICASKPTQFWRARPKQKWYIVVFQTFSLQAINSPEACKKRLFKYVVPVLSFSIAVNLPKFFEAYVETEKHEILPDGYELWPDNTVTFNGTILENFSEEDLEYEYHYRIEVTDLRKNPYYTIYYTNWTRFFIMGIIPTVLLIYFNYKVIFLAQNIFL